MSFSTLAKLKSHISFILYAYINDSYKNGDKRCIIYSVYVMQCIYDSAIDGNVFVGAWEHEGLRESYFQIV